MNDLKLEGGRNGGRKVDEEERHGEKVKERETKEVARGKEMHMEVITNQKNENIKLVGRE